jgi:hypothetical protein
VNIRTRVDLDQIEIWFVIFASGIEMGCVRMVRGQQGNLKQHATGRTKNENGYQHRLNELSSAEDGVAVFSASTGSESSYEKPEWNNGAFTKALVEGLNGAADLTGKGRIT